MFPVWVPLYAVSIILTAGGSDVAGGAVGVVLLFVLATFLASLAVTVRRLHDTHRSGWWY